jgi:hypothetical protein
VSTLSWSDPSHNRLSRPYVLSAAWQRHVHDRRRALKQARYLSLKVTGLPRSHGVPITGVCVYSSGRMASIMRSTSTRYRRSLRAWSGTLWRPQEHPSFPKKVADPAKFEAESTTLDRHLVAPQSTVVTNTSARSGVAAPVQDVHAASVVPSEIAAHETTTVRASSSNDR